VARESEAERSLRELQEGMQQRDRAREASAGGRTRKGSSTTPAVVEVGGTRRPAVAALAVGAVLVAGVAVLILVPGLAARVGLDGLPGLGGSEERRDGGSTSYYDADFATSYDEASPEQAERGRQAVAIAEELDAPAPWVQVEDQTDLSMRDDGENVSAIYGRYFNAPADYTAEDFTAWFERNEAVRASDPADLGCEQTSSEMTSCELVVPSDDPDVVRLSVTATFFASTGPGDEPAVIVTGYSL